MTRHWPGVVRRPLECQKEYAHLLDLRPPTCPRIDYPRQSQEFNKAQARAHSRTASLQKEGPIATVQNDYIVTASCAAKLGWPYRMLCHELATPVTYLYCPLLWLERAYFVDLVY